MCREIGPVAIVRVGRRGMVGPMAASMQGTPNERGEPPMATTAEVAAVVEKVQRKHRGKIRWSVGEHTAELALKALDEPPRSEKRPSSKSRRRKRSKRLL